MPVSETPRGRDDVVFRQLADDWVLFDPDANQIHVLNLSAALVWTSCTGDRTLEEIAEEIASSYGETPSRAAVRDDVETALARFSSEGLLE